MTHIIKDVRGDEFVAVLVGGVGCPGLGPELQGSVSADDLVPGVGGRHLASDRLIGRQKVGGCPHESLE